MKDNNSWSEATVKLVNEIIPIVQLLEVKNISEATVEIKRLKDNCLKEYIVKEAFSKQSLDITFLPTVAFRSGNPTYNFEVGDILFILAEDRDNYSLCFREGNAMRIFDKKKD